MSDYSISYSTGWYSISPSFAWWHRPVFHVDTVKQSKEAEQRKKLKNQPNVPLPSVASLRCKKTCARANTNEEKDDDDK